MDFPRRSADPDLSRLCSGALLLSTVFPTTIRACLSADPRLDADEGRQETEDPNPRLPWWFRVVRRCLSGSCATGGEPLQQHHQLRQIAGRLVPRACVELRSTLFHRPCDARFTRVGEPHDHTRRSWGSGELATSRRIRILPSRAECVQPAGDVKSRGLQPLMEVRGAALTQRARGAEKRIDLPPVPGDSRSRGAPSHEGGDSIGAPSAGLRRKTRMAWGHLGVAWPDHAG